MSTTTTTSLSLSSLLYDLIQERNNRETNPYIDIHASNADLLNQLDTLQKKCDDLERQNVLQQEAIEEFRHHYNASVGGGVGNVVAGTDGPAGIVGGAATAAAAAMGTTGGGSLPPTSSSSDHHTMDDNDHLRNYSHLVVPRSESAALRNERKMREQLERLEEQLKDRGKQHEEDVLRIEKAIKETTEWKEMNIAQEKMILHLKDDIEQKDRAVEHLTTKVADNEQMAKLAEQQYTGLKDTIRILQDENNKLTKEKRELETRFVSEKERLSSEVNKLTDIVDRLKREADTQRSDVPKTQEEKPKSSSSSSTTSWFGFSTSSPSSVDKSARKVDTAPSMTSRTSKDVSSNVVSPITLKDNQARNEKEPNIRSRKLASFSVIVPTEPKITIQAHHGEASCARYDYFGANILATGGIADGTVKIWDTLKGNLLATMKGGGNNAILTCDVANDLVAGGGTDKTCRIWNFKTQRMVHHLVGHGNKITCVRFFDGGRGVVTASADRQMKVWDISKQTYRQISDMRLNSTANSIDVSLDSSTVVSGHIDGGIRCWDIRTGQRSAEIEQIHNGSISSVQFHPTDSTKILTNGMDSRIRIVDIRNNTVIHTLSDNDFQTSYSWSSSSFSPDGTYVASGSSSNGIVFVWDSQQGQLVRKLGGTNCHVAGVCGFAWGLGGDSGQQQVASVDKSGRLVLWR